MKIIDLSVAIDNETPADPPGLGPKIIYKSHKDGAREYETFFPGLNGNDLPDSEGPAVEILTCSTHVGTHLDAPWHFASTMNHGQRALTIDEIPLDWCIRPGVRLDFRHLPDGHIVSAAQVQAALEDIGHKLSPFDIVLMNTSAGAAYGQPDYIHKGCGFGREATLWLLDQGVRITGTDAWSWDPPFSFTRQRFAQSGDAGLIWEGHKAGREGVFLHLEKLTALDQLPSTGFTVSCLPVKVRAGSAGWCRAVAIMP